MRQTKKGNQWRFGMKCHAGVDAGSGLVHTITATAANVHDIVGVLNNEEMIAGVCKQTPWQPLIQYVKISYREKHWPEAANPFH